MLKAYIWLQGEPLAMIATDGSVYYYHNDHLGTPQKMTDSNASEVWSADYLPFGQANVTLATVVNNLRFAGQYYDGETGLHYNYWRYYDPGLGRYLRADPIGLTGGISPYVYVQNNPVMLIDPWGLLTAEQNFVIGAVGTTVSIVATFTPVAPFGSALGGMSAGILTLALGGDMNEALWNGATAAWGGGLFNWALKTGVPKVIIGGLIGDYGLDLLWAATAPPWVFDEGPCP